MDANCIFQCQLTAHSAATAKWYLNIYKDGYKMNDVEQFVLQLLREFMYPVEFNVTEDCSICKDCVQSLPSMLAHISDIRTKQSYVMEAFQDAGLINNDEVEIDVHSTPRQMNSAIIEREPNNNTEIERKLELLMSEFVLALQQNHDIIDLTSDPKSEVIVKAEPVCMESVDASDTSPNRLHANCNCPPLLDNNLPPSVDDNPTPSIDINHLPSIHSNPPPSVNDTPLIILEVTSLISEEDTEAANILLNLADQSTQFDHPATPFNSSYNVSSLPEIETEQDHAPLDPKQKLDFENGMNGMDSDLMIAEVCDMVTEQPDNSQGSKISEPIIPSIKKLATPEESKLELPTPILNLPRPIFIENSKPNNKIFSCDMCIFKTKHRSSLKRHIHMHTGSKPKPHNCSVCDYRTANRAHLEVHMRLHTGHRPYKCTACDFTAMQKSNLQRHVKTHSGGTKPHPCPNCSFRAASKSDLLIHSRTHSGEKPFMCELCSYRGPSSSCLATHKRKHSDYRPYSCSDCEYTTKFPGSLKLHQRTHSGNKPFQCTKCNYKAVQKSKVKRHMTQVHKWD